MRKPAFNSLSLLLCTWGMLSAQTPVTVGNASITIPANWQVLQIPGSNPYVILTYAPNGQDLGGGTMTNNDDTSAAGADSMARILARNLGYDGEVIPEGDSAFSSGSAKMSWAQFVFVDSNTDSTRGRFYFAHNGFTGLVVTVCPETRAAETPMYHDITNMLRGWGTTPIYARRPRAPVYLTGSRRRIFDLKGRTLAVISESEAMVSDSRPWIRRRNP
jgi:hypothetical protein